MGHNVAPPFLHFCSSVNEKQMRKIRKRLHPEALVSDKKLRQVDISPHVARQQFHHSGKL
jgi:hypothetical protein